MSEKEEQPEQIQVNARSLNRDVEIKSMLSSVLNFHGVDNNLKTPHYILGQYLFRALEIYEEGLKAVAVIPKGHPAAEQDMRDNIGKYIAEKSLDNFISTTRACDSWHKEAKKNEHLN